MTPSKAWTFSASLLLLLLLLPRVPCLPNNYPLLGGEAEDTKPRCNASTYSWCANSVSAKNCKVEKECSRMWSNYGYSPVVVKVFYETLCPGCRGFVTTLLFPTWLLLSNNVMDVVLVPYGNAEERFVNGTWQFDCQHGKLECDLNMIQTCVLDMLESPDAFVVVTCMLSAEDIKNSLEPCLKLYAPKISVEKIMQCANGPRGNELMHKNAQLTDNLDPPKTYTPWVLVNENHLDDMEHLLSVVCASYQGPTPDACKRVVFTNSG